VGKLVPMRKFKDCNTKEQFRSAFEREVKVIQKGWHERSRARDESGDFDETPEHWRTRRIYKSIKYHRDSANCSIFMDIITERKMRFSGRYDIGDQLFKLGMLIIFFDDRNVITPQRRSELGDAMEYAYRHNVSSRYLNGFIKQAGLKKIRRKLSICHKEPGFKK